MRDARTVVFVTAAALALGACTPGQGWSSLVPTPASVTPAGPVPVSRAPECTGDEIGVSGGFAAPAVTIPDHCDSPNTLLTEDLIPGGGLPPSVAASCW